MSVRDADADRLLSVPSVLSVEPALSERSRLSTAAMLPSARLACPPLPSSCTVNCSGWSTSSSRGHGPTCPCDKYTLDLGFRYNSKDLNFSVFQRLAFPILPQNPNITMEKP